ncbi:MAG: hypothetical protein AAFO07_06460, partial [Bacteroidota bacterium]
MKKYLIILIYSLLSNVVFTQNYYWPVQDFTPIKSPELAPSYYHRAYKALAINSVKYPDQTAAVQKVFEGKTGIYDLGLYTLTETDGECKYEILVNGQPIGQFTNPRTTIDYWPYKHQLSNIFLNQKDTISIHFTNASNGRVPEGNGFAYARGRWTGLEIYAAKPEEITPTFKGDHADFHLSKEGVTVICNDKTLIHSLPNAHWSIGTNWKDAWPNNWHFAKIDSIRSTHRWVLLYGQIEIPRKGSMLVRDAYTLEKGVLKGIRRWQWTGADTLTKATLAIQFMTAGSDKKIYLPGLQYYGNPSGEISGTTPWFNADFGERSLFEEHRFPMPFALQEIQLEDRFYGASLHSIPSPVN